MDNGQGIDEQSISHLFDRYYRGTTMDAPTEGTGLGMAIVELIVTAHQRTIDNKKQSRTWNISNNTTAGLSKQRS